MRSKMRVALFLSAGAVVACALAGVTAEWYLSRAARTGALRQPVFHRISATHAPFAFKYPHSAYGFFFIPENALGDNPARSIQISPGGFRGAGPESVTGRKLAFLVGNSVVFGFVDHDSLTITGFLNRLQTEYFFVNAGAPSWVSSQARDRTIDELLGFRPSLVILWGGHNDARLAYSAARKGLPFAEDRVESPSGLQPASSGLLEQAFPHLTNRIGRVLRRENPVVDAVSPLTADSAATAFVNHLAQTQAAAELAGAAFIAVYQPLLHHHSSRPPGRIPDDEIAFFERFHSRVFAEAALGAVPVVNFGALFDSLFVDIPVFDPGRGPDLEGQVFVDPVHLYVLGNRLTAEALVDQLPDSLGIEF